MTERSVRRPPVARGRWFCYGKGVRLQVLHPLVFPRVRDLTGLPSGAIGECNGRQAFVGERRRWKKECRNEHQV
ncbi:MAG: hypothetical protein JW940_30015, partial [Polyangiaceae bacterium]|nr:hypothetical protein [Polyangiaceae bacterium]